MKAAIVISIFGAGFVVWALCRAAARGDRVMSEAWENRQKQIEMETEFYEEHA